MGESGELKCSVISCDRGSTNSLKYTSHIIISFPFKILPQIKTPILKEILAISPLRLKFLPPFKGPNYQTKHLSVTQIISSNKLFHNQTNTNIKSFSKPTNFNSKLLTTAEPHILFHIHNPSIIHSVHSYLRVF